MSWSTLRIPGVLQRLALAYLVVACLDLLVARAHLDIYTTVSWTNVFSKLNVSVERAELITEPLVCVCQDAWWSRGMDVLLYWPAWVCVLLLESVWLLLTFLLPVPDCPT